MTDAQRHDRAWLLALDQDFLCLRLRLLAMRVTHHVGIATVTREIEAIDRDRLALAELLRDLEGDEEITPERRAQ
ncbi:MAG TPA: hypothetical protein VNM36_08940 [Gemmatimonadaceae bacterium]|jgi:hypothetical protein|nr:hypothetical protein [Gemmatimonadaceae bacterium]